MKKTLIENVRTRGYKLLLYADNPQHMRVLSHIRRDPDLRQWFVGCWHIQRDDEGCEIIKGAGKKHAHIVLDFPNARYWHNVCRTVGLVSSEGAADPQFCRAIGYNEDGSRTRRKETVRGGYVYLIHANKPEAEQYSVSDLFGAPAKLEDARAAIVAYQMRNVSLSDSLLAIREWVISQYGQIITPAVFVKWVTSTPYVRSASNPWVRQLIDSHNQAIYASRTKDYMSQVSASCGRLASGCETVQQDEFQVDFGEGWEPL